ncbi:MAG: S8 family serine peptidase [Verrucomicrobia bacterium]|nr:S8 family serine peptidase [Verrucomicrobiota bacterium]
MLAVAFSPALPAQIPEGVSPQAAAQIQALIDEKASRTPTEIKIDSQLLYALRASRGLQAARGVPSLEVSLQTNEKGLILVDIKGEVGHAIHKVIERAGGSIVSSVPRFGGMRAWVPLSIVEEIASLKETRVIRPASPMRNSSIKRDLGQFRDALERAAARREAGASPEAVNVSEGVTTHRIVQARTGLVFTGLKIGVLSDSIDDSSGSYANAVASGDVPPVTVLPGQSGGQLSGEGLAMLEAIADIAPGAQLYFATAFNGSEQFAQNILDLRAAGCDVIVDDVSYFDESPFFPDSIEQAVNAVTAQGCMYFSSAGNQGNRTTNSSSVWEGDFTDGGPVAAPLTGTGRLHQFPAQPPAVAAPRPYASFPATAPTSAGRRDPYLFWSDPRGASSNDYDLFYLDATGATVLRASTNVQNGTQDPIEVLGDLSTGTGGGAPYTNKRFVIVKSATAQARYLSLNLGDGYIQPSTGGRTKGHNASRDGFSVAAAPAVGQFGAYGNPSVTLPGGPFPGVFTTSTRIEPFTSEGPRQVFFNPDQSPITPGNFLSTGGNSRPKPDFTAADGTATTLPPASGLNPFFGTSNAAPHAGGIAAIVLAKNPNLTPAQMRTALTSTAIDIEAPGFDSTSGAGILDAPPAVAAVSATAALRDAKTYQVITPNGLGTINVGDVFKVFVPLTNPSGSTDAVGVNASLTSLTPGVSVQNKAVGYATIAKGTTGNSGRPFLITVSPTVPCGSKLDFVMTASFGRRTFVFPFSLPTNFAVGQTVQRFDSTNVPTALPDNDATGINFPITVSGVAGRVGKVKVSVWANNSTYIGDLVFKLRSPDGREVVLSSNVGGGNTTFGTGTADAERVTFDDDAAVGIEAAQPPFAGTFRPAGRLSTFVGTLPADANGTWTLNVSDQGPGDVSTFQTWSIFLQPIQCN